jgi:hypothetical protein
MNHECTRRSLLQLLGITIGAAAIIPANAQYVDIEPSADELIVAEQPLASPTRLERFIRSHGIKPAHLARESGYSRQHLLRLRFDRMRPSLACIVALVSALRRLTNKRVTAKDLFAPDVMRVAWRDARLNELEDYERVEMRATFGRPALRALFNGARS